MRCCLCSASSLAWQSLSSFEGRSGSSSPSSGIPLPPVSPAPAISLVESRGGVVEVGLKVSKWLEVVDPIQIGSVPQLESKCNWLTQSSGEGQYSSQFQLGNILASMALLVQKVGSGSPLLSARSLRSEDLSVNGGKFRPLVVGASGVKRVPDQLWSGHGVSDPDSLREGGIVGIGVGVLGVWPSPEVMGLLDSDSGKGYPNIAWSWSGACPYGKLVVRVNNNGGGHCSPMGGGGGLLLVLAGCHTWPYHGWFRLPVGICEGDEGSEENDESGADNSGTDGDGLFVVQVRGYGEFFLVASGKGRE
ncbi:hypothetical protein ARMGADRAFT_1030894 [Armillaria gallica]|uniref:Uncharacterized protein n=1 Tax=Armillaria gallica TaxID=47427 RepID=A0A2H3DU73_ARMGA|nr:hypothetical protein ARMGADRAFT_1030894 [Armillaria gallica]